MVQLHRRMDAHSDSIPLPTPHALKTTRVGADLADGQWHHAAFTWNEEKRHQRLYVDGALVASNRGPQGGFHSGSAQLGRANTGGAFIGGSLDEFRIYSRCLSAEDVRTLSQGKASSP
ncbi:MAG TPA: hypothetical protein DDZ51_24060 [Planctomycetaceae bacterium]|nr:hypothetical protein [Planctomycetaceae bacterium]